MQEALQHLYMKREFVKETGFSFLGSLLTLRVLILVPLSPETVYILIALSEHIGGTNFPFYNLIS